MPTTTHPNAMRALLHAGTFCLTEAPLCAILLCLLNPDESSDFGSTDEHCVIATGIRATVAPLPADPVTDIDVARVREAYEALGVTDLMLVDARIHVGDGS